MQTTKLALPNGELDVIDAGEGPAVLFLHGAGGLAQCLPFIRKLAETSRVIAPVHPGFDGTATPAWLDSIDDVAYLYTDLLDALALKTLDVVGFSLGGWIGLELGIRERARVRSMTLVAPPGMSADGVEIPDYFLWDGEERLINLFHDKDLARRLLSAPVTEAEEVRRIQNFNALAKLVWSPRWHSPRLEKWCHRLSMPVHLIWGENDGLFPPAVGESHVARLPNARLSLVPDCGHLVHVEQYDRLCQLVGSTLSEVRS